MQNGGKLKIRTFEEGDNVFIITADTGVGIPDEIKPKIFQPLMTTKSKGQGFGLAVVKRLVEAQGGTITFESRVGKGTKFKITFPKQTK
jgi:signal transduction histidine kinase